MSNCLRKVLVTGSQGQLGRALCLHPLSKHYQLIARSHAELDITNISAIQHAFAAFHPDVVINAAAYTAVDKAEHEIKLAMRINHFGAEQLAIACNKQHIPLIHISTDYIFDGKKTSPYLEDDEAGPINIYGKSKWLGEQAVRNHCEQHIILRVSGIFSEYGNNFFKTMLRLANEKKELRIVCDQITCPTFAPDIAYAVYSMIEKLSHFGTYHYCSMPPVSWHQFASHIIHLAKKQQALLVNEIKAISTSEYPTDAKRPAYSVLDCNKIAHDYGTTQPSWKENIEGMIHGYLSAS